MINDELLKRFLHQQCTEEEARMVASYLQEHPELLEKYLPEAEFLQLQEQAHLPEPVSRLWLKNIHQQTAAARHRNKWIKRLAIVAVTAGVLVGGTMFLTRPGRQKITAIYPPTAVPVPSAQQQHTTNTGNKTMAIVLPDGSVIRLLPAATVIYDQQFTDNRNIYLTGEAEFTVAADKSHPFVVYSGELHTTALGTWFHVKAIPGDDMISVRLNSGKVMVQGALKEKIVMKDVILTPGKVLNYYRKTGKAIVSDFNNRGTDILVRAGSHHTGYTKPDWYKFNDQPMSQVLDQLSDYYGTPIYYYPSDVVGIYFDGKFEKTDSLEKVLMDVTLPNNMTLIRNDSGFIIRKK